MGILLPIIWIFTIHFLLLGILFSLSQPTPFPSRKPKSALKIIVFVSFLGGFLISLPTILIFFTLPPWGAIGGSLRVAALEELSKAVVPIILIKYTGIVSIRTSILFFLASALGFSLFESALYFSLSPEETYLRSVTSLPLHLSMAVIFGFAHGISVFRYKSRSWLGWVTAVILHGFYNLGWKYSPWASVGILIFSILLGVYLVCLSRKIEG